MTGNRSDFSTDLSMVLLFIDLFIDAVGNNVVG